MIRRRRPSTRVAVSLLSGLVVVGLVAATSATAQNSGSQADQDACTPDVFRLCQDYIPNETPIVACLKVNRSRLSPACYHVFYSDVSVAKPVRHRHKRHHKAE